jgi:hypothetical protein
MKGLENPHHPIAFSQKSFFSHHSGEGLIQVVVLATFSTIIGVVLSSFM